jgi:hypothetical protein
MATWLPESDAGSGATVMTTWLPLWDKLTNTYPILSYLQQQQTYTNPQQHEQRQTTNI